MLSASEGTCLKLAAATNLILEFAKLNRLVSSFEVVSEKKFLNAMDLAQKGMMCCRYSKTKPLAISYL